MKIGDFEVRMLSDGYQRLDGGAMFGVVPKVLWEKRFPADERNRILLALNCLLIRTPTHTVLVDTGIGGKEDEKFRDIYGVERGGGLEASFARAGLKFEDVDFVINSHLHFDHAGGNTKRENGRVIPAFPRAVYVSQREEWQGALEAHERNKASYLPDNYMPLHEAGRMRLLDGEAEVVSGISVVPTPGHSRMHQGVKASSGGQTVFFLADIVPTTAHVPLPWIMSYDLYPEQTLATRKEIYARALGEDWIVAFDHDPKVPFGRLHGSVEKPILEALPLAPGDYITPFD
jgi:glyoxylase-like metal-dependent hydrolase (beta-lactamase superfamily II)